MLAVSNLVFKCLYADGQPMSLACNACRYVSKRLDELQAGLSLPVNAQMCPTRQYSSGKPLCT